MLKRRRINTQGVFSRNNTFFSMRRSASQISGSARAKKLLLMSLDLRRPKDPPIALGTASILANLRQACVPVIAKGYSIADSGFSSVQARDFIMRHAHPDTDVAFGAFVWNDIIIKEIIADIKDRNFPGRIILGGPQITYAKSGLERIYPQAEVFIRGYAENSLLQLMQRTQQAPMGSHDVAIQGVHYAGQKDLELLSALDLRHLASPLLSGIVKPQPFLRWETKRGCPFSCAFCQHKGGTEVQEFSRERIEREIQWIVNNSIINDIAVVDPTFNFGESYLYVLAKLAAGKYAGKLALQCRPELVNGKFLDAVESLNQTANVVLEFGLQTVDREEQKLVNRSCNIGKIKRVLRETHKRDIQTEVSLIYGLPGQTLASFKRSVDFCIEQKVPIIKAFPLMLLRGTALYDQRTELGLVERVDSANYNIPHVVSSPTFTHADFKEMAVIAADLASYNADNQGIAPSF